MPLEWRSMKFSRAMYLTIRWELKTSDGSSSPESSSAQVVCCELLSNTRSPLLSIFRFLPSPSLALPKCPTHSSWEDCWCLEQHQTPSCNLMRCLFWMHMYCNILPSCCRFIVHLLTDAQWHKKVSLLPWHRRMPSSQCAKLWRTYQLWWQCFVTPSETPSELHSYQVHLLNCSVERYSRDGLKWTDAELLAYGATRTTLNEKCMAPFEGDTWFKDQRNNKYRRRTLQMWPSGALT